MLELKNKAITKLNLIRSSYKIFLRYYPGGNHIYGKELLTCCKNLNILPSTPKQISAMVVYNNNVTTNLIKYNYALYVKQNAPLQLLKKEHICTHFKNTKIERIKTPEIDKSFAYIYLTPLIENTLDYLNKIEPSIEENPEMVSNFIKSKSMKKEVISENYLKKILLRLNEVENLNIIEKEILFLLKENYFVEHPLTIENARLFIKIWDKGNYNFAIDKSIAQNEAKNVISKQTKTNSQKEKSYVEKKKETEDQILDITNKINLLFSKHENNPEEILNDEVLYQWYKFLINRNNVLPMQAEEIAINEKLNTLYIKYAPKKEDLLINLKDNMKTLKESSDLPNNLKKDISEKCFTPEDFAEKISYLKQLLTVLNNKETLKLADLKLLAILCDVATIDDEGTFKLTQETYRSLSKNADSLALKYFPKNPQVEHILEKIKNKDFFVINEINSAQDTLVQVAHLSHKTLVVHDDTIDKDVFVRIGLLTSSKDDTTIQLDQYQQTNPDPDKRSKNQMFRIFTNFLVVDEKNEPLAVDLETTLLFRSLNSSQESIPEMLFDAYQLKKDVWSNNPYQSSYNIDTEFLHNLCLIFGQQKLAFLTKEADELKIELNELLAINKQEYDEKLASLNFLKKTDLENKRTQQYFSLLSEQYQTLHKALKLFDIKSKKYEQQEIERKRQDYEDQQLRLFKAKKQEEQLQITEKTAKQKKEAYLQRKRLAKEKENNNDEKII